MAHRIVLLLALLLPTVADAQTLDKIRKSGVLTLGYIDGAAPFSFVDGNGEPQGYSVELCRAVAEGIAAQLKRTGLKTRWVKLTIQDRIDAVRKGQVDLECSTTTCRWRSVKSNSPAASRSISGRSARRLAHN